MFVGSMVALVTPMQKNGSIDHPALKHLVDWHLASKTNGIIVAGTTGESPTLSQDEQTDLITRIVKQVQKQIPVIAGTGTNCTSTTITKTQLAEAAGADACLVITPYYNKPTQEGLYQHFKLLSENTSLPIILYNAPGRTGCNISVDTIVRLAQLKNIIGIKDATSDLPRGKEIVEQTPQDFILLSGDDIATLELMRLGAVGTISVTANVAPDLMQQMCQAALAKDYSKAALINEQLVGLHKNLFLEANPIPVKWALQQMGLIAEGIRLPLLPLDQKFHALVQESLTVSGIILPTHFDSNIH